MDIEAALRKILPADRIKTRYIDLVSYGADAGFYYLLPKAVARPVNEEEVIALFDFSRRHHIPLTFRTGGTSLSGQSITDGILVDLSQFWNRMQIEAQGALVRVQPGITGAMVNAYLRKFQRKIGPDPSSISSAMMGGILSNNSSGMCCGVKDNAYHTTKYIRFILPDGKVFNTERPEDYSRFEKERPDIFNELLQLRTEIIRNPELHDKIRKKYKTKNTVGYALNALIDHEHPLDIMARLLIGGEGTLAFISEAVLQTVPDHPCKATSLLYFPDIYAACQAIVPLRDAGAEAVELMDRASLRSVERIPGMPAVVQTLPAPAAALLVEFQEKELEILRQKVDRFLGLTPALSLLYAPAFTYDHKEQQFLWKVRKGLFPAVGAVRRSGTTVVLEDVAFPVEKLGDAIIDLQRLFATFRYDNAIIFGHAKDGNIHFVVTQSFNEQEEVGRYDRFLNAVVDLVVKKYDGTLKAEHGTGRNMAPFVETEWGGEAYRIMKRLKQTIDPLGLLNPGVIINDDPKLHIRNLKELPTVEEEVDKCIECGYCEHKCPSRDVTLTPRRRIVARRELAKLKLSGEDQKYKLLLQQYQYDGLDTCSVDGLCATACPVDINTGDLVKRLRRENHSAFANRVALWVAGNFKMVEMLARFGLKTGSIINAIFGARTMTVLTRLARKVSGAIPLWSTRLNAPPAIPRRAKENSGKAQAFRSSADAEKNFQDKGAIVYFAACISRLLGAGEGGKKNIMETFLSVSAKAGIEVILPEKMAGTCCGQIFSSKGYQDAYRFTVNKIIDRLWETSMEGRLPVVTDVSSCAYTLMNIRPALSEINKQRFDRLKIMDSVQYLYERVIPASPAVVKKGSIVLHPVCSLQKMGTQQQFVAVAKHFAGSVTVPVHAGCCGMAGDRGFLFPELTASATRDEALEVSQNQYDGYYSSTKTCEIAMSEAVKKNYESILYLADEALS
ncbi:MAG TPA: FAD-binding and (Fe-S)-binding domain-containing protein [Flavitalea sp.]|nr:FAD-binding and (Fe-S)-binding domain-containing protein [Flavitalea sp.]